MSIFQFARSNARALTFGLLHSFYSAPGQTFVIGLFVAAMGATIGVGPAEIGALYLAATLSSAATLIFVGHWIDHIRLVHFSAAVVLGLAVACFATAIATTQFGLFVAFYLLRLTGQGLMMHVESTATARTFDAERGRALSITALGAPLSEVVFPPLAIAGVAAIGWQATYAWMGVIALLVIFPVTQWLLRTFKRAPPGMTKPEGEGQKMIEGLLGLVRSRYVRMIVPALVIFPFHATAVMFHISTIAEGKGWGPGLVAMAFPMAAAASVIGLFLSGQLIDRYTARGLFVPVYLPFLIGIALMAATDAVWTLPVSFFIMGFGGGMARTTMTAIWAELFGVRSLGAIRSAVTMFMVFNSGLSPFAFGLVLEAGFGVSGALWTLVALGLVLLTPAIIANRLKLYRDLVEAR